MTRNLIENEVVELDYKSFDGTEFRKCTLVYKGGLPPRLKDCSLIECQWVFEGPALNTVMFMRKLANSPKSEGLKEFVLTQMLGLPE